MAKYELWGDESGLPHTKRSNIPYEIESLSPREMWGAATGSTTIMCRVKFDDSVQWIKDMVGEVGVAYQSQPGPLLVRYVPEVLRYNDSGLGSDTRIQFCTQVEQIAQGGNSGGYVMGQDGSHWPEVDWVKYRATFEAVGYAILDYANPIGKLPSIADMAAAAGANAGAYELYRYIRRSRRSYSREQPIPAASKAGGFKVVVDPDTTPTSRNSIGQVGFRVVSMADVTYTWERIPAAGWPPPIGWTGSTPSNPWPPKVNPAAVNPDTVKRARDKFIGTINKYAFDCAAPDGYGWPVGTLLYKGYTTGDPSYDAAGDLTQRVEYSFQYKEGGWNSFLDALGNWREVSADGSNAGKRPYDSSSFDDLFRYASS